MIKITNLSYSFPEKELYNEISFEIEEGQHCAFIGSNGTGKSTLVDMIMHPQNYLYDGKIEIEEGCRMGYVSQFSKRDKNTEETVFAYLAQDFVRLEQEIADICEQMGEAQDLEPLMERYQELLDLSQAMDADNYESNIRKQLKFANLSEVENLALSLLSGGEYKLVQVMKQMIVQPDFMVMDEPDVFLDFANLNSLRSLINNYKGTILVVTHNRYLLNHCFNKILHLENADVQEFDGDYNEYNYSLLEKKIELMELAAADQAEIERNEKMVLKLRAEATKVDNASKGRALHARVTHLARLEARKIKAPFVEIRQPDIHFPEITTEQESGEDAPVVLRVSDYSLSFDKKLLSHISFEIKAGEKVAIVGANGTGKTTLLRDIFDQTKEGIWIDNETQVGFLSQFQGDGLDENRTVCDEMYDLGFTSDSQIKEYLKQYCFSEDFFETKVGILSGGEKNLLQIAEIGAGKTDLLLLDEPTSHLDMYAQLALEKAMEEYKGTILMVSHDFYTIADCVDYVLFIEDKSVRRMNLRSFRRMIYANHFGKDYLELEQKKKQLETKIAKLLEQREYESVETPMEQLFEIIEQM